MINKKDIQKRVTQNGKILALSKFSWDPKAQTFSSAEDEINLDFSDLEGLAIKADSSATIKAGSSATIKAGYYATIDAGYYATIKADSSATIKAGSSATIKAGDYATIKAGDYATIDAGYYATIKAGYYATIDAGDSATIDAGDYATIDAVGSATIKANGKEIVIVNRNILEVVLPEVDDVIQICPGGIEGHLKNGMYKNDPHIVADGILSKVIKQKGPVYNVINHGETEKSYIIKKGDVYAHGKTLKEARDSMLYKISDRDKSQYEGLNEDSILSLGECIAMYRVITGACESGARYFVESLSSTKKEYSVKEIIDLTEGQYGNQDLIDFIK